MLRRVSLVRTDVSEELSASFIRVTRIGELGTTLAVTSKRRKLWMLEWNSELWMHRGVGGGEKVAWVVNGQSTKRGPKLRKKGRAGLFVNTLWMRNRIAKCPWVMSRKFGRGATTPFSIPIWAGLVIPSGLKRQHSTNYMLQLLGNVTKFRREWNQKCILII
jgi:hypothetical protein